MADKLETTPAGIVCKVCGQDKPRYHYFHHSGVYNKSFFTTQEGFTSGVCFDCASPYRCVSCGQVKPASEYRVQGRVCLECREASKMPRQTHAIAEKNGFDDVLDTEYVNGEITLETADFDE